jgi:hypothetical protein
MEVRLGHPGLFGGPIRRVVQLKGKQCMRKPSKILSPAPATKVKDPMNDDHYDSNDEQIAALKELVTTLQSNQKKPRKKKTDA